MKLLKTILRFLNKIIMALENKKLSAYGDLASANIDTTTKLVVLTGATKINANLPVTNFIEDSLTSTSVVKPLSANQGKVLKTAVDLKETIANVTSGLATKAPTTNPTGGINNYAPKESPTFTGNVVVPVGDSANEAVNKSQLDLKESAYILLPVNTAGLTNETPTDKHFGIYTFNTVNSFEISLSASPIGSRIVIKNIGDFITSVFSAQAVTIDGQDVNTDLLGTAYTISGAYNSKTLYKNTNSSWITI